MPRYEGVYDDGRGGWYYKLSLGRDPATGRRVQVTKRGFRSAGEAARARKAHQGSSARGPVPAALTVNDLLDLYLDGLDADGRLSAKTRFDYRKNADSYVRPFLGEKRVGEVTSEAVVAWQRHLMQCGGAKNGKPLAVNTVRLARVPLVGAFRMAVDDGVITASPVRAGTRPRSTRRIPKHWTPEEARQFLHLEEPDRLYPVWAFMLVSGVRIGELVSMRWTNIDLRRRQARVVEFVSTLGWDLVTSSGKSATAVRTVDLDENLVRILERQYDAQRVEARAPGYEASDFAFTRAAGGPYHPQTLSKTLSRRAERAGLPRLTAHGLRHTSATLMLASGVPPKVAAERLGHSNTTLFFNLYSHVTPTMQHEAATLIGIALFGAENPVERTESG